MTDLIRLGIWWFTAHLMDLALHAGVIEEFMLEEGTEREVTLLKHAEVLINDGMGLYSIVL